MGYNRYHVIYSLLMQLATDPHVTPLPPDLRSDLDRHKSTPPK